MSKPRFFVGGRAGDAVMMTGPDAKHIAEVLRLGAGAVIEVVDAEGFLCDVELEQVERTAVSGRVIACGKPVERVPAVYLFQGLPKAGKLDDIVRKATEIGVAGVVPVITGRTVVKLDLDKAVQKRGRWQKIAEEAAKQAHRVTVPEVSKPLAWRDALEELAGYDQTIVFWEEERERMLFEVLRPEARRIALIIGPEGGLSEDEVADLTARGAAVVTLGDSILRTETAGPVAVALVLYESVRTRKSG